MSLTDRKERRRIPKRGWKRAGLAVLTVFLISLTLALVGLVPETGIGAGVWMPFAAVAGWFAYRGDI